MYNGRVQQDGFMEAVRGLDIDVTDEQIALFMTYKDMLQETNEHMNLTAITDDAGILEKHFLDSLLSVKYCRYEGSLCDVGSGAGFPGIPLKIVFPDLAVTLLEPKQKRCRFLEAVIEALGLKGIEVIAQRAEDHAKERREYYDIVTARAVSGLNILSELCVPLLKVGGKFVILKGSKGAEEIAFSDSTLYHLGVDLREVHEDRLPSGDKRLIAIGTKIKKTAARYPRHYSEISKRPL